MDPVQPSYSLSCLAEFRRRPPLIALWEVADLVFHYLFTYANKWRETRHLGQGASM